jgi:hypothetical protein
VCLKWAVQRGQIPIPFSVHEKNYAANLRCVTEDPLSPAEMASLAKAERNCRLVKGQVFLWKNARGWEDLWDLNGEITGLYVLPRPSMIRSSMCSYRLNF